MARRILFAIDYHRFHPGPILFFLLSLFCRQVNYLSTSSSLCFVFLRCRPSHWKSRESRSPSSLDQKENVLLMTPGCVFSLGWPSQDGCPRYIGGDFACRDYFCFCLWKKKVAPRSPTRRARHVRVRELTRARLLAHARTGIITPMTLCLQDVTQVLPFCFFEIRV